MKRSTTLAVLCGLLMLADLLVLRQTIAIRNEMSMMFLSAAFFVELLSALVLAWLGAQMAFKSFAKQKKIQKESMKGERFSSAQPTFQS